MFIVYLIQFQFYKLLVLLFHTEKSIELTNFFLPSQQNFSSPYKKFCQAKSKNKLLLVQQIGLLGKLKICWESKKVLSVLFQQSGWLIQQFYFLRALLYYVVINQIIYFL